MKKIIAVVTFIVVIGLVAVGVKFGLPWYADYKAEQRYREIVDEFWERDRYQRKPTIESPEDYQEMLDKTKESFDALFVKLREIDHPEIAKRVAFAEHYSTKISVRLFDIARFAKLGEEFKDFSPEKIKALESGEPTIAHLKQFAELMSSFHETVNNDYEQLRADLAKSGLQDDVRRDFWSSIDRHYSWLKSSTNRLAEAGARVNENIPLVVWLIEHRSNFTVDQNGQILFSDRDIYNEYAQVRQRRIDAFKESVSTFSN